MIKNLPVLLATASQETQELERTIVEPPNLVSIVTQYLGNDVWSRLLHTWQDILFSVVAGVIICLLFYFGSRQKRLIPKPFQNALEMVVEGFRNFILSILGPEGDRFVPFLGALFFYLLTMNLFGLVPLLKPPSASINIAAAHAICVFLLVQYLSIRYMGFFGYLHHLAGAPKNLTGWILSPLLLPIELLTQLARPFTLAFRLFGNIFGEEIVIGYFALLGIVIVPFLHPLGIPLQVPFLFLGLLTSVLQALVFTLLTTIYILLSIPNEESH